MTTFLLWLLPRLYVSPESIDAAVGLHQNVYYMARLWVNFGHIFLALAAYGAAAYLLSRRTPGLASFGYVSFVLWGFTELLGVTVNIFAVNRTWRAAFATASPEARVAIRTNIAGFQAVWDAMFFLLLVAFLLGTACFGLAAVVRGDALSKWLGAMFLLAVPLTLAIMVGGYTQITAFNLLDEMVYPVLQPLSRGLLAYWLWRNAGEAQPAAA